MSVVLPPDPVAAVREERALRGQQRWAEAEALLAAAVAAWPNDEALLIDHGLVAQEQMHWAEMAARFAVVGARCPGHVSGHSRQGEALRWLGRFDEAEAAIGDGVPRFPDNTELLVQWVLVACDRAERGTIDWRTAERRGQDFIGRLPELTESYRYAAEPFVRQRRWAEAEVAVAEGLHRLGPTAPLVLRFAELATAREDWATAARRWEAAIRHLPDHETAWLGRAEALRQADRLDALETLLAAARLRFPDSLVLARELAWAASLRRDWAVALARWRALAARTPDDVAVQDRIVEAELQAGRTPTAAAPPPAPPQARGEVTVPDDPKQLLLYFEPLGKDCELGLVQRHVGLEPLGLLRFGGITLDNLIAALDSDLTGIGASEFTHVFLRDGAEYMVNDTRYGLGMHTFTGPQQVSADQFFADACRRLRFLARKLLDDLRTAEKIFVRTSDDREPLERIVRLHRALLRHGPATLLFVQDSADPARIGHAEWLAPGLMVGWIERFSITDPLDAQWHLLCRSAYALWRAEPPPPERRALVPGVALPTVVQPIAFAPAPAFGTLPTQLAAPAEPPRDDDADDDPKTLLLRFEPLGRDCEFGLVQRQYGLEPLHLLHNAALSLDSLIAALDNDFAGIGEAAFTRLRVDEGGEYMIDDTRYGLGLHTFRAADQVAAATAAADAERHLKFLVAKLLADLRQPTKMFLRASDPPEPPARLLALHRALCRHGAATLLAVERSADPARIGRAEWLAPGVMRGWIERFSTLDPQYEQWVALCGRADAMWRAGARARAAALAAPRTLVFCTSYVGLGLGPLDTWDDRYRRWRQAVAASRLHHDQTLMIDDASPSLPGWADTAVIREGETLHAVAPSVLFRFDTRLGRRGLTDFPGWVRSFFFAAHYAAANGFDKVVHLESDAFVIADPIQQFINAVREGWVGFWCPRYDRPEGAIQVIAGPSLRTFRAFSARDPEALAGVEIEKVLPFTRVERRFRGDRYGEYLDHVPRDAEWSAQTTLAAGASRDDFYWWLKAA